MAHSGHPDRKAYGGNGLEWSQRRRAEVRIGRDVHEHLEMTTDADTLLRLQDDVRRGLKIANELILDTQTVEEACLELVRLVRMLRKERDEHLDELSFLRRQVALLRML